MAIWFIPQERQLRDRRILESLMTLSSCSVNSGWVSTGTTCFWAAYCWKKKKMKANKTLLFKSCFLAVLLLLTESVLPDKLHSELAVAFAHLWDHAVYTHLLQSFGQCSELLMSVHEYLCEAHKLSPCSYFPVRQRGRHGLLYWAWRDWILSRLLSIKLVKK